MSERILQEIFFDEHYLDKYVAIREERLEDGRIGGVVIASGSDPDEVHGALRRDRREKTGGTYYFCKPSDSTDIREGWAIGEVK